MVFIFLGLLTFGVGLFMYRHGKKTNSNEEKFGSYGMILGGLVLTITFILVLLIQGLEY